MASPKFVHYHQDSREPKRFAVLKMHKDGTVDIGPENGDAVVTSCVLLDAPKPGHCTPFEQPEKQDESDELLESKKVEQLRDLATSLSINVSGLKKDELIAAIKSAQAK